MKGGFTAAFFVSGGSAARRAGLIHVNPALQNHV